MPSWHLTTRWDLLVGSITHEIRQGEP
jgi:hypothetical protein